MSKPSMGTKYSGEPMTPSEDEVRELKPCPLCHDDDVATDFGFRGRNEDVVHYVVCMTCGARGGVFADDYDAIAAWNRRAEASGEVVAWMVRYEPCGCEIPCLIEVGSDYACPKAGHEKSRAATNRPLVYRTPDPDDSE